MCASPLELCKVAPKDAKPYAASLLEGVGITEEQMWCLG